MHLHTNLINTTTYTTKHHVQLMPTQVKILRKMQHIRNLQSLNNYNQNQVSANIKSNQSVIHYTLE